MKRSGFSMIELVFVIVILGVLAAVAVPRFVATRTDAQVATARSDLASAMKAVVAKVFADNIDPKQSEAPKTTQKVSDFDGGNGMAWGDWIIEVAGMDGARWQRGGNTIKSAKAVVSAEIPADRGIQPLGNIKESGTGVVKKGGCGMILGIDTGNGNLVFAPNNATAAANATSGSYSGTFCDQLGLSYQNSQGPGNRVIPLASTGTIEF